MYTPAAQSKLSPSLVKRERERGALISSRSAKSAYTEEREGVFNARAIITRARGAALINFNGCERRIPRLFLVEVEEETRKQRKSVVVTYFIVVKLGVLLRACIGISWNRKYSSFNVLCWTVGRAGVPFEK